MIRLWWERFKTLKNLRKKNIFQILQAFQACTNPWQLCLISGISVPACATLIIRYNLIPFSLFLYLKDGFEWELILVRNDRSYHVPWLQLPVEMFVTICTNLQELKYVIDTNLNRNDKSQVFARKPSLVWPSYQIKISMTGTY